MKTHRKKRKTTGGFFPFRFTKKKDVENQGRSYFTFGSCTYDKIDEIKNNNDMTSIDKINALKRKSDVCCTKTKRRIRKHFCDELNKSIVSQVSFQEAEAERLKNEGIQRATEKIERDKARQKEASGVNNINKIEANEQDTDKRTSLQRAAHKVLKKFGFSDVFPREPTKSDDSSPQKTLPPVLVTSSDVVAGLPKEVEQEQKAPQKPKQLIDITLGQYIKFLCLMKKNGVEVTHDETSGTILLNDNFELVMRGSILGIKINVAVASLPFVVFDKVMNPDDKEGNFTIFLPAESTKQGFLKNIIDFYERIPLIFRRALNAATDIKNTTDVENEVIDTLKTPNKIFLDSNFVADITKLPNSFVNDVYLETFLDANVIEVLGLSVPKIKIILKNCDKVLKYVDNETREMPQELNEMLGNVTQGGKKRRRNKKTKRRLVFGKRKGIGTHKRS